MKLTTSLLIRGKVIAIFVPVALLFLLQAGVIYLFVSRLNEDIREMAEVRMETVLELNAFMRELSANQQRYQLLADQDNTDIPFESLVYEVFAAEERLQAHLSSVEELFLGTGSSKESESLLQEVVRDFQAYNDANRTVTETFALYTEIDDSVGALLSREQEAMRGSVERIRGQSVTIISVTVTAAVLVVLLSMIIALLFANSLRKPIRMVAAGLHEMAGGEGDLTKRLEVTTKDEVGEVAAGFNTFTDMLGSMVDNLKHSVEALMASGEALAANAEQTAASVNQINANAQSITKQIEKQSESVESSTASVEEISRNIESLEKMIEDQAASVSQSTASIEEMVANVQSMNKNLNTVGEAMGSLVEAADNGRSRMNQVSTEIEQVAGKSEILLETNSILSNIAAQTNLLSMNAAIEAAHAGDAGAGFAVVAAEIRKLAENSSEHSGAIAENLKGIKNSIDSIVSSSKEADSAFGSVQEMVNKTTTLHAEVSQAMEEQAAGGRQVLEGLSQINEITSQVRTGAQEMREGSTSVTEQMNNLTDISREVREGMQEISTGTSEIRNGVQELQETSQENQEIINRLAEEAEQFKT